MKTKFRTASAPGEQIDDHPARKLKFQRHGGLGHLRTGAFRLAPRYAGSFVRSMVKKSQRRYAGGSPVR
ncbi:MAG: hypothetical protein ACLVL7_04260 [Anaerotruncus massiliensis (ex Togo et al. 2019)]